MRILFITPRLDYSGAPKIMTWVANSFLKCGYDVTVLTYFDEEINRNLSNEIKHLCAGAKYSSNWFFRNIVSLPRAIAYTVATIGKGYDVIISFADIVSIICLFVTKILFPNKRHVISERGDPFTTLSSKDTFRRKLFRYADRIVFQTEYAMEYFNDSIWKKSVVIPNPVIVDFPETKVGHRDERIVYVGRLENVQKRVDLLVDAFALIAKDYPEIVLEIYGDGRDEAGLRAQIKEYKIEKQCLLKGRTDDVYGCVHAARLFVISSEYEGIPNSLLEAMSMGVPVVSTDCRPGGARLLIDNYRNGIIVPRGDAKELANAMRYMLDNPVEAEQMGNYAKEIKDRFSEDKIIDMWKKAVDFS